MASSAGGGRYGHWLLDAAGLPAYAYTLDQLADKPQPSGAWAGEPASTSPVRSSLEHTFQLGNNRVVAIATNFGACRIRQDEGSPKVLNDAQTGNATGMQFGGGFGHLTDAGDATLLLTTYFNGGAGRDRRFGVGYAATSAMADRLLVNHTTAVPAGDAPVALVQVEVRNLGTARRRVRWAEVWGSLMAHLDPDWARLGMTSSEFSASHYSSSWERHPWGVLHRRRWRGLTSTEQERFNQLYTYPRAPGDGMWDERPPVVFLAAAGAAGAPDPSLLVANDAGAYFAAGGAAAPAGGLRFDARVPEAAAALIASRQLELEPNGVGRLNFVYGYLPHDSNASAVESLVESQRPLLDSSSPLAHVVAAGWAARLPNMSMASTPWLGRETAWHAYYLQGGITYDSYREAHIVDQGTVYRPGRRTRPGPARAPSHRAAAQRCCRCHPVHGPVDVRQRDECRPFPPCAAAVCAVRPGSHR